MLQNSQNRWLGIYLFIFFNQRSFINVLLNGFTVLVKLQLGVNRGLVGLNSTGLLQVQLSTQYLCWQAESKLVSIRLKGWNLNSWALSFYNYNWGIPFAEKRQLLIQTMVKYLLPLTVGVTDWVTLQRRRFYSIANKWSCKVNTAGTCETSTFSHRTATVTCARLLMAVIRMRLQKQCPRSSIKSISNDFLYAYTIWYSTTLSIP